MIYNLSFQRRLILWAFFSLFIFSILFPLLQTSFFVNDAVKTETKTVIKSEPKEINTRVCYINKNGKNYHHFSCKYVNDKSVKTTIYEAQDYNRCWTCADCNLERTSILVEEDKTKTVTQTEKEIKEYNYLYPIAICSVLSFWIFIPLVQSLRPRQKA